MRMKISKQLTRLEWEELIARIDNFLFDADGVLWNGNQAIPGSIEVVEQLKQRGKKVCLITNNSTRSRKAYAEKCLSLGFKSFTKANIVTTSAVLAHYLKETHFQGRIYVIGSQGVSDEISSIPGVEHFGVGPDHFEAYTDREMLLEMKLESDVSAVVVGFDGHYSYPKCMKAASYLRNPNCLFIATNADETMPSGNPRVVVPGTGSILAGVVKASGREPNVVLGKPNQPILDVASHVLGGKLEPRKTLMVGDRCNTDVKFASDHGMVSLFVETGANSLEEVREHQRCNRLDLVPDYLLSRLGDILPFF